MRLSETINPPEYEGKEKHVPQIHAPEKVKPGEWFEVTVIVGEEVPHPNTPEHHISWITVFYKEDGPRPVYQVAHFIPTPVYGDSRFSFRMKAEKPGQILALEHCNIHGLWDNSKRLEVE
jgi:superoxide reductase